ncbi:MAG: hypothetical protein ACI4BD_05920 [Paludibacteraceae bacterium]
MDNKTEIKEYNGGVTSEQIQIWKNTHGRISEVRVDDPDVAECHIGYFRRPDMKTMQAVSAMSKTNEMKGAEVMFDNCWLGGSPMMKEDAILKMQGMAAMGALFGSCTHSIKNL